MEFSRRAFIGAIPAAAVVTRLPQSPGSLDPLGVRADFPVAESVTYLNSAYITPSPVQVTDAAKAFIDKKSVGPVSLGTMLGEVDSVRRKAAELIGATERELGVLFATSDGENVVTRALDLRRGDNVVVDDLHYETSYLLYQQLARERGVELRVVESRNGTADPAAFERYVDRSTRLVSVAWVSHQNGFRHDLKALSEIAHGHDAYLYTDAIQGLGMLELDVKEAGVDFLTAGTYKWLLGGFGVAPFYVREDLLDLIEPDRYGSLHIDQTLGPREFTIYQDGRKYGYATMAFGAVYQLSAALDYLKGVGVDRIEAHTVGLADHLGQGLRERGFDVLTPAGNQSAVVAFVHGANPELVRRALEAEGIQVSLREEGTQIRVGAALFNTSEDIDRFLAVASTFS